MKKRRLFLLLSMVMPSLVMAASEPISCPTDKPLVEYNRDCFSCDTLRAVYTKSCSELCPNRILIQGDFCALKECPSDNPMREYHGTCSRNDIHGTTDWECAQIPNTQFFEDKDGSKGTCTLGCPEDKPIKITEDRSNEFKCFSCDDTDALDVGYRYGNDNCLQCPNRELKDRTICVLKGECPKEFPIRDERGACRAPDDPLPITFVNPNGGKRGSYSSRTKGAGDYQKEQCDKYPERTYVRLHPDKAYDYEYGCILKTCPKDKPMRIDSGCYSCATDRKLKTDEQTCQLCPNRIMYGNLCSLPCPKDKPLADKEGRCHSCDENEPNETIDSPNCSVCPNRYSVHTKYSDICLLKCPEDKPLRDEYGKCHSCEEVARIHVASEEVCQICPNRVGMPTLPDNSCVLCSKDKPQLDADGNCHACLDPEKFQVKETLKNMCQTEREIVDGYSVLKACPSDKPLRDKNGGCFACDNKNDLVNLEGVTDNCKVCPNRKLIGRYCMIPCPEDKPILEVRYGFPDCSSCNEKGEYGIGWAELEVTGAEEQCNLCPNRRIQKTKKFGEWGSYCIVKD